MARGGGQPHKIAQLDLERLVIELRARPDESQESIVEACNEELARRQAEKDPEQDPPRITRQALARYLRKLDSETTAVVHAPQHAERNARFILNLGEDLQKLHGKLETWLEEADEATIVDKDGHPMGPDWQARTSVAREFRGTMAFYADVLERIYNAEQVRVFQTTVMTAIGEADEETARKISARLDKEMSIRRSALLGSAG